MDIGPTKELDMLNLHSGGHEISYDDLGQLYTPPRTETHVPLPHCELVDMVRYALGYFGHTVEEEHHAIDKEGARYFGLLTLKSDYGPYTDTIGLRNSVDKIFPAGIAFGSRVFVCSNLAFAGDHVIKRKHTAHLMRDLPGLVAEVVRPLRDQRLLQAHRLDRYRGTDLTPQLVDQAIMGMYREGVVNLQRIPDVMQEFEEPTFEEFKAAHNVWRLFNAATFVLTGRVSENPGATTKLHRILDGVCERLN